MVSYLCNWGLAYVVIVIIWRLMAMASAVNSVVYCMDTNRAQLWPDTKKSNYSVKLETRNRCKLGVSWYPNFIYNAEGGGGNASGECTDDKLSVRFEPNSIYIPPVWYSTTKFLGLPLPPPIKIDIKPRVLEGFIYQQTGLVELRFVAEFMLTVGSLYRAPPLLVDTLLTTESSKGKQRSGKGCRLDDDGICELIGVAEVSKVNDAFLDTFLTLPTECLALMRAKITIT